MQANIPLLFFVFFLLIVAAGRGKLVWNSLSAKEKKLRLAVLGVAIVWAVMHTHWILHRTASF